MAQEKNPGEIRAEDVLTRDVITFQDSMGIYEAIQKMTDAGIRRMPIVDDAGKLIGIVTMDDIVRMLGEEMAAIAKNIEKQSPPYRHRARPYRCDRGPKPPFFRTAGRDVRPPTRWPKTTASPDSVQRPLHSPGPLSSQVAPGASARSRSSAYTLKRYASPSPISGQGPR